jgi:hypothetical protein
VNVQPRVVLCYGDSNTGGLNAAQGIISSDLDGVHFDADQHSLLGKAVTAKVAEFFAI